MTIPVNVITDPRRELMALPDPSRVTSAPWGAHPGGSYLTVAFGWLALFGPRPTFIFSTQRREPDWQQWDVGPVHHGLAAFKVGSDGWLDEEPLQTIPRKKPCQVSARQYEGRA